MDSWDNIPYSNVFFKIYIKAPAAMKGLADGV